MQYIQFLLKGEYHRLSCNLYSQRGYPPINNFFFINLKRIKKSVYMDIPLDKLYIIDESIRQITITLFIINFMNNLSQFN